MLTQKIFTYQEYLSYKDNLEIPYELIAGKIVEMPPESYQNVQIALRLMMLIADCIGIARVSNKAEIIISGSRITARVPDITVFSEAGLEEIVAKNTSTIDIDMLPPLLVVVIVSPGKDAHDRDYRYKRSEYAARGIEHYWIVDPIAKTVTLLDLVDGLYQTNTTQRTGVLNVKTPFEVAVDLDCLFLLRPSF